MLDLNKKIYLLDGAMGTMLQSMNIETGSVPEMLNITAPQAVISVHRQYAEAGSDIIYTNTLGANRFKASGTPYSVKELISAGVACVKEGISQGLRKSGERREVYTALSLGPTGRLMAPGGDLTFELAFDVYSEMIRAGYEAGADAVIFETFSDIAELRAAVLAAKECCPLPVMCTMTFEAGRRTFTGVSLPVMAVILNGLGVDAIGLNCSLGPDEMLPMAAELIKYTHLPVIIKPNAGLPDAVTGRHNITPAHFIEAMRKLLLLGAGLVGGCCGTNPEFIRLLRAEADAVNTHTAPYTAEAMCAGAEARGSAVDGKALLATSRSVTEISGVMCVGERINPSGKPEFEKAIAEEDCDYPIDMAFDQVDCGADILDINTGTGEDTAGYMAEAVTQISAAVDVPLFIDSADPKVLEAALRVFCGKAVLNSVTARKSDLDMLLPLAKKYGAAVVGLTMDDNGIPKDCAGRIAAAKAIVEAALAFGLRREDIYIDCLTPAACTEPFCTSEVLQALEHVKHELGVKTVLGISNISYGMKPRAEINAAYLLMALSHGLDMPILNPCSDAVTKALKYYRMLCGGCGE